MAGQVKVVLIGVATGVGLLATAVAVAINGGEVGCCEVVPVCTPPHPASTASMPLAAKAAAHQNLWRVFIRYTLTTPAREECFPLSTYYQRSRYNEVTRKLPAGKHSASLGSAVWLPGLILRPFRDRDELKA
jgi:hypothetical protein